MAEDMKQIQIERLQKAGINLSEKELQKYLEMPDDLGIYQEGMEIPVGFKRCGGCKHVKKFYLFNVNNSAKNKCTGNCKECQKKSAKKSYEKTKDKRDYKKYYRENVERKREHGRKYYELHKEEILAKQKEYRQTAAGRKVMRKAHRKRRRILSKYKGIPYKREWVIDRDKMNGEYPICYLCDKPITNMDDLHLDHVIPIALKGKDCFTNVAVVHKECNLRKEKDARNLKPEQIEEIIARTEKYIDDHPELFEDEDEQ